MAGNEVPVEFRAAKPEEDDVLSRILCNAFLPIWNHNWFHGISEPLSPVDVGQVGGTTPPMTNLQKSRVKFYRSLINLTRLIGGEVLVADVPSSDDSRNADKDFGAIILWLPPFTRLGGFDIITLWRSGFLGLVLPWHYGLGGLHRIDSVFESNVHSMFSKTLPDLPPRGFKDKECGFLQMIASNPRYAGKGYASKLLKYQMAQHFVKHPDVPVILDTTTTQGIRAYERLGFKLLAEKPLDTGTDERGIRLKGPVDDQTRQMIRDTCIQRVLVKLP
ncbi:hypothetical protein RBB50_000386 [Rhinocladiella similis]